MTARGPGASDDGASRNPRAARDYESFEGDKTREGMGFAGVAQARPATARPAEPVEPAAPTGVVRSEPSEPIRVFSMKDQTAPQRQTNEHRAPLHIQLRSLAEVAGRRDTPPAGMGRLAPPRDPVQAKTRRWRANAVWACVVVALAAAIALAIWLVAGRAR